MRPSHVRNSVGDQTPCITLLAVISFYPLVSGGVWEEQRTVVVPPGQLAGCIRSSHHQCSAKRFGLGVRQAWTEIFTVLSGATTGLLGSAPLEQYR